MKQTRRSLFASIFGVLSTPALLAKYQEYPEQSIQQTWTVINRFYCCAAPNFHFRTLRCPVGITPPKFLYCKIEENASTEFTFGALELYHVSTYKTTPNTQGLVYRLPYAEKQSTVSIFTVDVNKYQLQVC